MPLTTDPVRLELVRSCRSQRGAARISSPEVPVQLISFQQHSQTAKNWTSLLHIQKKLPFEFCGAIYSLEFRCSHFASGYMAVSAVVRPTRT